MRVVYLEPTLFYPNKLNLKSCGYVSLESLILSGGEEVNLKNNPLQFERPLSDSFIVGEFAQPVYIDVSTIEDTEHILTIQYHYKVSDGKGTFFQIYHKQYLQFCDSNQEAFDMRTGPVEGEPQYTTFTAVPASIGKEGLHYYNNLFDFKANLEARREDLVRFKDGETDNVILHFGVHPNIDDTWVVETISCLKRSSEVKHCA